MKNRLTSQIATAIFLLTLSGFSIAGAYKATLLSSNSVALAINNGGMVAGLSGGGSYYGAYVTIWNGSMTTVLGPGSAASINDFGQIGGDLTAWSGAPPVSWNTGFRARGINNSGQVVGSWNAPNSTGHAALWNGTTLTDLGLLDGTDSNAPLRDSNANDINNAGQIVGHSSTALASGGYGMHATIWNGTKATDLGTIEGWQNSFANAINDSGDVVGWSHTVGFQHATLWKDSTAIDLGTLGGNFSRANAINDKGQVVGYSNLIAGYNEHPHRATLWNGTVPTDLNTYLDPSMVGAGWVLNEAYGINEEGTVVGFAYNSITNERSGFILSLSAVPEPTTYALMLVGLGLIAGASRGRSKQQ
jgi:probable HAF family extracellular repeat protein